MRVVFEKACVGTYPDGWSYRYVKGEWADLDATDAKTLVEAGVARPVARKTEDSRETRTKR